MSSAEAPNPSNDRPLARRALAIVAWIFLACLTVQVFLAGMGVFVQPGWFQAHRTLRLRR